MPTTISPKPNYSATAVRPSWAELPARIKELVEGRLGGAVVPRPSAGSGFTSGFAAEVLGPDGPQFVKAANSSTAPYVADCYRREALINQALPAAVPAPRVRWIEEAEGWVVLGLDAVEGARMPADPWRPAELVAVLDACAASAQALVRPTRSLLELGLKPVADDSTFENWRLLTAGMTRMDELPEWFPRELIDPLADLESNCAAAAAGNSVLHLDLRRDNVVLGPGGRAWICDWNWPCLGPSWFDLTLLLATAHADGHDASQLFAEHPTAQDVDPEQLDAVLAALTGHFLRSGAQPPPPGSPALRQHQAWCGEVMLRWLTERRHWQV
ncbi:hypothetical protein BG452_00920 [Streptomyces sp. CBMA123]|nr:hypothetical protein [Streptomyces sp. CBMA123]